MAFVGGLPRWRRFLQYLGIASDDGIVVTRRPGWAGIAWIALSLMPLLVMLWLFR